LVGERGKCCESEVEGLGNAGSAGVDSVADRAASTPIRCGGRGRRGALPRGWHVPAGAEAAHHPLFRKPAEERRRGGKNAPSVGLGEDVPQEHPRVSRDDPHDVREPALAEDPVEEDERPGELVGLDGEHPEDAELLGGVVAAPDPHNSQQQPPRRDDLAEEVPTGEHEDDVENDEHPHEVGRLPFERRFFQTGGVHDEEVHVDEEVEGPRTREGPEEEHVGDEAPDLQLPAMRKFFL